jgi:hypothetical protein
MTQTEVRQTAGELSQKIAKDNSKYDAMEVGHYMTEGLIDHFRESVRIHKNMIDEKEFCCVMIIAEDPLIKRLIRRKFYCWPYLPSPRPNQTVFLYNKEKDMFTKRLWILPCAMVMAELAGTNVIVDKRYETQQAWSIAFFEDTFWEFIRYQHGIDMLSEREYFLAHRKELIEAGCKIPHGNITEPFDFTKISVNQIIDPQKSITN